MTPRLRIISGDRQRGGDFVALCDPATMAAIGWTPADVGRRCSQFESGSGLIRLVTERLTGRAIGCVVGGRVGDTFSLLGWVGTEFRRQGFGSEALEVLCTDAFASGCRSVLMAIPTSDPGLVPFVEQHQFVNTGSHQMLSHDDAVIDTLLYRRLPSAD